MKYHLDLIYSGNNEPNGLHPCTELGFWYNINILLKYDHKYDIEEIKKTALWRIIHIIDYYSAPDGAFKGSIDGCKTKWVGFDMAVKMNQSDIFGSRAFSGGIIFAAVIAGLDGKVNWHLEGPNRKAIDQEGLLPLSELEALINERLSDVIK